MPHLYLSALLLLTAQPAEPAPFALQLWQQGQDAMLREQPDQAIALYQQSLQLDPTLSRNFLSLAAAHLQKDETDQALPWLGRYVAVRPDHLVIRSHYAELLGKAGRLELAEVQWHRFVTDVQKTDRQPIPHLIQAHTRLVEIAARRDDTHAEQLHRGIGLYWLACLKAERNTTAKRDDNDEDSPESLLCQATIHLQQARRARPESARACWYLHRVWSQLGQQQSAQKWLRETSQIVAGPTHDLTSSELHDLELARASDNAPRR